MIEITIKTALDIAAPADKAWTVLGEGFGDWANWSPGIDESTLKGPLAQGVLRVNKTPSLGTVTQELVRFDRDERALAYEMIEGLPPFLERLRNDWQIEATDGGCRLVGEAIFGLRDAAAPKKAQIEAQMTKVLTGFGQAFTSALAA